MTVTSRSAPIEITLEIANGRDKPRRLVLRPGQVRQVGRGERVDLSIPEDSHMSTAHFAVECDDSGCRVRDLRSSNGVFVNGERVTEARVVDGDRVLAGKTEFAIRVSAPHAPAERSISTLRPPKSAARPYVEALKDEDPEVRRSALLAAASTRQPWLLDHCRNVAQAPTLERIDDILLLAVLAEPKDVPLVLAIGRTVALGSRRFEVLGTLGHPDVVPILLEAIRGDDPSAAIPAAQAFTKVTGIDLALERSAPIQRQVLLRPVDDESDPLEAPDLPSIEQSVARWARDGLRRKPGSRVCRGVEVSGSIALDAIGVLDMESLWDSELRAAHRGSGR